MSTKSIHVFRSASHQADREHSQQQQKQQLRLPRISTKAIIIFFRNKCNISQALNHSTDNYIAGHKTCQLQLARLSSTKGRIAIFHNQSRHQSTNSRRRQKNQTQESSSAGYLTGQILIIGYGTQKTKFHVKDKEGEIDESLSATSKLRTHHVLRTIESDPSTS